MVAPSSIESVLAEAAAFRRNQQMDEALDRLAKAASLAPTDPRAAFGYAQTSFECWRPAAELFAAARTLIPDQPDLVRNHALALAAEGDYRAAVDLLDNFVAQHPLWLDGHRALASLRITHAEGEVADASYARACTQLSENAGLRLAWFQHHAIAKDWNRAAAVLDATSGNMVTNDGLDMARIFLRSECDDRSLTDTAFAAFTGRADPGFDLCHIRHLLRRGRPEAAATVAQRHLGGKLARNFWPYLSLCWRLLDDSRALWLDGDPLFTKTANLHLPASQLAELADALRGLHRMKAPYPEQSVRNGTQTDRQLFFHPHPAIQNIRRHVGDAIRDYVANLPDFDAGHPLLGHERDSILFEGSWSVRLSNGGFHTSHTHALGWISSALYVALPEEPGVSPAGCLALGAPPDLGLELEPYCHVEPKAGSLALFPSTMWHGTEAFASGERLTIAFDVKIPDPVKITSP